MCRYANFRCADKGNIKNASLRDCEATLGQVADLYDRFACWGLLRNDAGV